MLTGADAAFEIDGPVNTADWHSVSSLLSHWKLAATSIEVRLTIKQLQEGMSRESTRLAACASLDKLAGAVFYSCKKPEEADFIADLVTDMDGTVAAKVGPTYNARSISADGYFAHVSSLCPPG